ncbi:kinesin family protein [Ophiocordyceps camponoti-floridani]|uniref:Kinesin family protein n=1 Tax=Ophiocordyceps camponoti-floridani TaxID=2030778 RepID=A0A8H4VEL2_9HYPO|nr:kinesin family protein [Ophiocordyceps camponoti-floridani]
MAPTPPASPVHSPQRPLSAIARPPPRCASRMSISSKPGTASRASDDDSRTAVRVAVRVRPPLKPSDPGFELVPARFQRSMVQTTSDTSLSIDSPQGRKLFVFDRVFSPDVMQDGVWDYLADSVSAFLQGYNVSLLAYGQSGAGKSYTMGTSGPHEQLDPDVMGVIPRAATALFEKLNLTRAGSAAPNTSRVPNSTSQLRTPRGYGPRGAALGDRNWSLKATYVEIYNEQLRDLLVPDSIPAHERSTVAIREDTKGNIILTGLHQVEIDSIDDLMNALNFGSSIRQTDATAINAKSSRSHAVFSLNLVQRRSRSGAAEKRFSVPLEAMTGQETSVTTDSKLHFVDLAGSERLKNTGAQGDRAKEGISINAGLASLGKVISQLSSRQPGSHVSYRDSKLTRLLQDSLGGNAITYMIACVTPAEFHLSETINTVQYAQRARAIQSKPRIQQIEEGDKQAVIDRLRAEVSFLREQIRSAAVGGTSSPRPRRVSGLPHDRSDRQNEREVELNNQLLDVQENYNALGRRHAMLIAEMAKARESESEHSDSLGDSATDRLNRSNSFAQAVEQVVLEYEKTIQTLEQSLSNTRATLSSTETSLLEKESRCAYVDTINNQLQLRLQKLMDREASTENYLHDLEAKLDGHTSGEEKNTTIIVELRKEIARVRENEASCEDYISTLEERLAEADQDAELMQREIDRLEQVIERQRCLGKLDSLLHELDHLDDPETEPESINGTPPRRRATDPSRGSSTPKRAGREAESVATASSDRADEDGIDVHDRAIDDQVPMSPSQGRLVTEKLNKELTQLRAEHETTVRDLGDMHSRYEEALQTLANLQDAVDEARFPPRVRDSVLSIRAGGVIGSSERSPDTDGPRSSVSRSLSSELSSAVGSSATADTDATSEDGTATARPAVSTDNFARQAEDWALKAEVARLQALAGEKAAAEKDLACKLAELEDKHSETLDMVEELKTEVSKARAMEATSPRLSTPIIRRKSSQNIAVVDRAHRSFTSLRNIAADNFDGQPEVLQNFELNLNAAMNELQNRSDRIQELEADVAAARKEMETKTTIISGLTRERSSLKSPIMDMSTVAALRVELERSEMQVYEMRLERDVREKELRAEIQALRQSLQEASKTPADDAGSELIKLQSELSGWESRHKSAVDSMQSTNTDLRRTVEQLEAQIVSLNTNLADSQARATADGNEALKELSRHRGLVAELEEKVAAHGQAAKMHDETLEQLKADHARQLSELQTVEQKGYEEQVEVLMAEHADAVHKLEAELAESKDQLAKTAETVGAALGLEVSVSTLAEQTETLAAAHKRLSEQQGELQEQLKKLTLANDSAGRDLEEAKSALNGMLDAQDGIEMPGSISDQVSAVKTKMSDLMTKNMKHSRLVEELEEQLQSNFDAVQMTNTRLSTLQTERNQQLEEAQAARIKLQAELQSIKEEYSSLQAKYQEAAGTPEVNRSNSNSTIRKSPSHASLPSPPPAIPLPPLPSGARSGSPTSAGPTSPSRTPVKEGASISQVTEDGDAAMRAIEKKLYAERHLTHTLEEALTDLEKQSKKVKADCDAWRKRASELELEVKELKERPAEIPHDNRWSLHAVEEERKKRQAAEAARKILEDRMNTMNKAKKKKGSLNCF